MLAASILPQVLASIGHRYWGLKAKRHVLVKPKLKYEKNQLSLNLYFTFSREAFHSR